MNYIGIVIKFIFLQEREHTLHKNTKTGLDNEYNELSGLAYLDGISSLVFCPITSAENIFCPYYSRWFYHYINRILQRKSVVGHAPRVIFLFFLKNIIINFFNILPTKFCRYYYSHVDKCHICHVNGQRGTIVSDKILLKI